MSDRPKVIIIGSIPPPTHGVTVYTEEILKSTLNDSFLIHHIDTSDHRDSKNYNTIDFQNIKIAIINILTLAKELIKFKPDLVYCSPAPFKLPFMREAIFIVVTKLFSTANIVLHIHSDSYFIDVFYKNAGLVLKKLINCVFSYSDCTIVLGKSLVKKYEVLSSRVVYLWNGIRTTNKVVCSNSELNMQEKIRVGFLSNLSEEKGIINLIKSIARLDRECLDKITVNIAGNWMPGEKSTQNIIKDLISKYDLSNYVKFQKGIFNNEDKMDFLSNIDIFIFPSLREAFPLVLLEAMSNGCAIISTNVGVIPEIIIDGETGYLVNRDDYAEITLKLKKLINSPNKIIYFALAGKRRFNENFALNDNILGLTTIFKNTLRKGNKKC